MARYDIKRKPESLSDLAPMILAALHEVSDLCHGKRWRMCVPVDDADSDIVIGDALRHSLAFVRAALGMSDQPNILEAEAARLRARPPTVEWRPLDTIDTDGIALFWLEWADDVNAFRPVHPSNRVFLGRRRSWSSVYQATHWMPLPAPPRDARDNERSGAAAATNALDPNAQHRER